MGLATRMDYMNDLYEAHEGNIHYIMNNFDLDGDDFDYLMELKEYRNE